MTESYELTSDGLVALKAQIKDLETDGRAQIAAQIKTARGFGDLKENAEYHAAKEAQAHLETKIARLRDRLNNAVVVEPAGGALIGLGSVVDLLDEASGTERRYELVSSLDADAAKGRLSMDSPVAQALRGLRAGETAEVSTPRGAKRWKVVAVA